MCPQGKVLAQLESLEELKSPPPVLSDILLSVFEDRSSTVKKRITLARDPGLTTRMLRVADLSSCASDEETGENGPGTASRRPCGSRLLILSIAVYNQLAALGYTDDLQFGEIWRRSLERANSAQDIAVRTKPSLSETAYMSALLLDLGMMVLQRHFPEENLQVRNLIVDGVSVLDAERKVFETDHQEVGSLVAAKWNMPEVLRNLIGKHHPADQELEAGSAPLSIITILADSLEGLYNESQENKESNDRRLRLQKRCCRELGIDLEKVKGAYSVLPKHLFRADAKELSDNADDRQNVTRMNNELLDLYFDLAAMFRERQELSRRMLQERYVEGTWESLNIALSTISHYINNSMSVVSGESEILKHLYDLGDKEQALARIPNMTSAIARTARRISILLDELSNIARLDELQYFKNSRAIDIQKILQDRLGAEVEQISQP